MSDFFSEENLLRLRHIAAHLQGHPNMNTTPPSVEMSTGSLGQGAAVGMAEGSKHLRKVLRVYTLLGDAQAEGAARHMTPTIFMIS